MTHFPYCFASFVFVQFYRQGFEFVILGALVCVPLLYELPILPLRSTDHFLKVWEVLLRLAASPNRVGFLQSFCHFVTVT